MNIGYTTATLDLIHPGHINFLKCAKKMCDMLIVGLTTDELAKRQKRETWFSYDHRKSVVESIKFVDFVVEHDGDAKLESYRKLKFTTLFIGDDYFSSDEYQIFEETVPEVKVVYIPRTSGVCTSNLISTFCYKKFLDNLSVYDIGVDSTILEFKGYRESLIMKPVHFGETEVGAVDGRDIYMISEIPNRNWKIGKKPLVTLENISGVNSYREILIVNELLHLNFIPTLYSIEVFVDSNPNIYKKKQTFNLIDVKLERKYPKKIMWLVQRNCGSNLLDYMSDLEQNHSKNECEQIFLDICKTIQSQINTLRELGVAHNDLHAKNICVDNFMKVSFIDFGWCMSRKFNLSPYESNALENSILKNSDWYIFVASLESCLPEYHKLVSEI